ncbi:MAG: alpha-mannosidase [Phycisphaerales bacterium]
MRCLLRSWSVGVLACVLTWGLGRNVFSQPPAASAPERCLVFSAENIVKGEGNWFVYIEFSGVQHTVQKGDRLEYDIFMPASNPVLKGGIDANFKVEKLPPQFAEKPWLREAKLVDQQGLRLHGDAILEPAKDRWYHRTFDLSLLSGITLQQWSAVFEGDAPGRYVQLLDNIRITRDGKAVATIHDGDAVPNISMPICDGYSRNVMVSVLPREEKLTPERLATLLETAKKADELRVTREQFRAELEVARDLAKRMHDDKLLAEIEAAAKFVEGDGVADATKTLAATHDARHKLAHAHPQMEKFTGHLVGHAHIDLQWLWTWDDCIDHVIPDTFGQAIKFMKEFPDFTFSQSSACLYLETERHYPELFKEIQKYVKEGRWELVGGRWCEGDNNMISPESHVRHLLYGQRYFQSRFGRTCTVGWEPDTFGHCWTMPQILKKAGIDSYYYCRPPGKDPLFWWEGPDGSKVLAFNEPASGGWYNGPIDDASVKELGQFVVKTNAMDHLMVYGVGNHGGGPTRENILNAIAMRQRGLWPNVKFSTATEFFKRLREQTAMLTIPTNRGELNPIFDGCYTSQSLIKKLNRDSETLLESAEVFAALARLENGAAYPREAFEAMWRDVTWNHHHDTLPGSLIHPSALFNHRMLQGVLDRGRGILERSESALAARIKAEGKGPRVVVFNPLAWSRTEVVEATVVYSATDHLHAARDARGDVPTQVIESRTDGDVVTARICFVAREVPGCGYKVFSLDGDAHVSVRSVPAGAAKDDASPATRFVILHEKPHGGTAWTIGEIARTENLDKPISRRITEDGPVRRVVRSEYRWDKSTIVQEQMTYPGSGRTDYRTTVDWGQLGNGTEGSPMLKMAFATGIKAENATYEIPFGDVTRKTDGSECVALKWCDLTGTTDGGSPRGVTVLNDCRHGHDVKDGTVRLTLLRASYDPDPCPDVGTHQMRYATLPHAGELDKAAASRAAWEFNKPLHTVTLADAPVAGAARDRGPSWSGCAAGPTSIIVTSVKRSEDGDDMVIRAYECAGRAAEARIELGFDAAAVVEVDLLEREMPASSPITLNGRVVATRFKPYEIRTFRIRMK